MEVRAGAGRRAGCTHLVAINISFEEETLALAGFTWLVRVCCYVFRIREHAATQEIPSASASSLVRSSTRDRHAPSLFTRSCGYAACRKGLPSPPSCKLMLTPGQTARSCRSCAGQEDDTLTHILFSAPGHGSREETTSASDDEAVMSVSLNPRAAAINVSFTPPRPIFILYSAGNSQ